MFEIDLLKGKARPYKTNLKRVVLQLALLLIPIGATLAYAVDLSRGRIELSTMRHSLAVNEAQLANYADEMQFLAKLRAQIGDLTLLIGDVGQALRFRRVTSPVLVELAAQLPPNIFLQDVNWRRTLRREQKPSENGDAVRFETIVERSLKLSVCGSEEASSDAAVQAYLSSLAASPVVAPLVREIRPAARRQREFEGENATVYDLELFLKDQR